MKSGLYGFLFAMWALIIIGGGIMVILLGPFTIQQFGDFHWIIASVIKVTIVWSLWFFICNVGLDNYWRWYHGCFVRSIYDTTIW